ncbi:hypothetical protein SRABI89_03131 [Pseudomonas koreensis]|nr:hypothetical protein SRABI89_03131 [Pseudomonas koreensis]
MTFPTFFQLSRNAISPTSSGKSEGSLSYWVFGCVEQRDANLKPLSQSARKRFAVMYRKAIGMTLSTPWRKYTTKGECPRSS